MKNSNALIILFASVTTVLMVFVLYLTFRELVQQSAMDNARRTVYQQKMMQAQHIERETQNTESVAGPESVDQIIENIVSSTAEQSLVEQENSEATTVTSDQTVLESF